MSNPLVDRILNNPLTFIPAKTPEKEVQTVKSSGYIVLNSSATPAHSLDHSMATKKIHKREETRPKSMAEAIAAYTGRKYLTKAEKKKQRNMARLQQPSRSDSESSESSEDEDHFESAPEYPLDSPFQGLSTSESGDSEAGEDEKSSSNASEEEDVGENLPLEKESQLTSPGSKHPQGSAKEVNMEPQTEAKSDASGDEDEDDDDEFIDKESDKESESESESTSQTNDDDDNDMSGSESVDDVHNNCAKVITHEAFRTPIDEDDDEDEYESMGQNNQDRLQLKKDLLQDMEKPLSDEADEDANRPDGDGKKAKKNGQSATSDASITTHYTLGQNNGTPFSGRIMKEWTPQYKHAKPVGLLNFGVTCYMNSAIQILVHIPAVQNYLMEVIQGKHSNIQPKSVTHSFAELALRMWGLGASKKGTPRKYINPKKMVQRLDDINCMMSEWQQEDSHEYFMSLMSRLQEDSTPKGSKLNQLILYDIFGGLLDQEVICQECKTSSVTKQEFYDLSLGLNKKRSRFTENPNEPTEDQILSYNKYTIEKSLRDFFSTEIIRLDKSDKSSGYYCEKCQKRTVATKKSAIESSPQTLMIHLKRFKFNGNSSLKVKQPIHYLKFLDLTPYSISSSAIKYQLMGVIVHEGRSILSGHYVSHCYQPDGTWSTYDDEYINKIDETTALSDPSAYCLVYTRLEEKPRKRANTENGSTNRENPENGLAKRARTA